MKQYDVVLVAIDGSKSADKAFERSLELAKHNMSKLVIGHVIDSTSFYLVAPHYSDVWKRSKEEANKLLEQYERKAKDFGLEDIETVMEYGSPKRTIIEDIAPRYKTDLIVVGATGINAVERFFLGSVSEGIMRYAKCDVYIVK